MVRKLLGIALCVVGAILLLAGVGAHAEKSSAYIVLFLAGAALIVLGGKQIFGKGKAKPNPAAKPQQPAAAPAMAPAASIGAELESLDFKIAGVSFGGRQTTLRKISEGDDEKYSLCTYEIDKTSYQGKPAFRVLAVLCDGNYTEKELGMVPADRTNDVLAIYDRISSVDVDVYGGPEFEGDTKYFGARATILYRR